MKDNSISISLVGDIFPANLPYNKGLGVAAVFAKEKSKQLFTNKLQAIFENSNIVFGNLESPIISPEQFHVDMQFAGQPLFVEMLKNVGVSIVTIANNHILEQGKAGFQSTLNYLADNNLPYVGIENGNDRVSNYEIIEYNSIKMGFVAYNEIDTFRHIEGTYATYNKEKVLTSIKELKEQKVDYIFVSLHWGDEYVHRPSLKQIEDAHLFIDAGANFIVGSHPHVIQPIEQYNNGLIIYSLGNFLFDMRYSMPVRTGLIVDILLDKNKFTFTSRYIKINKDFLPEQIEIPRKLDNILKQQTKIFEHALTDSVSYKNNYKKDAKFMRLKNRLLFKFVLFKNWFRYSKQVRRDFMSLYAKKIKK